MPASLYCAKLTVWRLCRWSMGYALRRWGSLVAVIASVLLHTFLDVLRPWPMIFLADYVLIKHPMPPQLAHFIALLPGGTEPMNLVFWSLAATVLLFLASWAGKLVGEYPSITLWHRMNFDLADDVFAKLQQHSLQYHTKSTAGDNLSRITNDCTCASVIVKGALIPTFWSLASLTVIFYILFRIEPILALISLAVVPCLVYILLRYAGPMKELGVQLRKQEGRLYGIVEETFSSIPVVQAFCREQLINAQFAEAADATLKTEQAVTLVQLRFNILLGLVTTLATAAIYWLSAHRATAGELSVGAIIAFLSYLRALYTPLQSIISTSSTVNSAIGSAERVWEILRIETQIVDTPGATPLIVSSGRVQLENVTFGYQPDSPVLRRVSLDVAPGQKVALVGVTGAGKTTLVSLLPRFFDPDEGRVLIDGQDLRGVQLKTLRRNISLVLQEPFLFPNSIAENIAFGTPEATTEDIEAAAWAANAHHFIAKLPKGYQTVVGERGATLSGGERQRISIARALVKNAPILILDEPTSALDVETEQGLLEALERLVRGRTTFIIAHRLSTVRNADRIIVLDRGRVAEDGTHQELLALGGLYSRFYDLQSLHLSQPVASA